MILKICNFKEIKGQKCMQRNGAQVLLENENKLIYSNI